MTVVHPIPLPRPLPPTRVERLGAAVARRALPVLAGSAAALVATLAAERAIRELALGALRGLDGSTARSGGAEVVRTVVTEVTVIEWIRRRA